MASTMEVNTIGNDQLQAAHKQLTANVEQTDSLIGAGSGDVLEEKIIQSGPDSRITAEGFADRHKDETGDNASDHRDHHFDCQFVVGSFGGHGTFLLENCPNLRYYNKRYMVLQDGTAKIAIFFFPFEKS